MASDIIVDAPPDVTILGRKVDVVDSFVYLGSSGGKILIFVEELSWPVHA